MNELKPYKIVLITAVSVLLNFLGRLTTLSLNLPLQLDSLGTYITAYALGPVCACIVALSVNITAAFYSPIYLCYALPNIFIALTIGTLSRKGFLSNILNAMTLSVIVTMILVSNESVLDIFLFDGKINNIWGQGISDLLDSWGAPFVLCVFIGQFYVNFLDSVISIGFLFYIARIYNALKSGLPSFVKFNITFLALFALFVFSPQNATAKEKNYNSYIRTIYNSSNGIPCGEANDIESTNEGVIWIGTYAGLYRYNGTDFRLMRDFEGVQAVKCLYVDDEGRLFVGTNDNGLAIVINERVANVLNENNGLPSDTVRCITRASNGLYYVGTSKSTAIISIIDGLRIRAVIREISNAERICSDSSDRIATVTSSGELFLLQNDKIIWTGKEFNEVFTSVNFGDDGLLYASTEKNTLYSFELSGNPNEIIEKVHTIDCSPLRHINSIEFFEHKAFLTSDNGIGFVENGEFHQINTGDFNNSIDHMTVDYQGNLWFSSSRQGVMKMCESAFEEVFKSVGSGSSVVNSTLRYQGDLYFATDNALSMIEEDTKMPSENALTEYLKNVRVRCLKEDQNGLMWICTKHKGLLSFDGKEIKRYGTASNFRVCLPLSDGGLAAGSNDGVTIVYNGEIVATLGVKEGFENATVLTLSELSPTKILAGTDGGGLAVIERDKNDVTKWKIEKLLRKKDGLSSNVILRTVPDILRDNKDSAEDKCGTFIITSNSICYMEKENFVQGQERELYNIRILDNFPYYNNFDMVINDNGDCFVSSSAGIFVVNRNQLLSGEKIDYELMDLKKGLRGSLVSNSWNFLDKDKNLYLSCTTGACKFNLNTYDSGEKSYRIQLKSVIIDNKRHIIQKDIPFVISADAEVVEIVPEIINYSVNDPYISFYLEGVDEKPFVMNQSEVSSLVYSHLNSGNYKFHLAVLDSKGKKTTEEAIYEIRKSYRFYDNWYFMVYAVGVFMLAVAWLSWYITSSILKHRIEKQEKEMESIKRQVRMGNETIFAIAAAVEARDKSTGKHSFRVAEYSVLIAKELGFKSEELEALHKTGLLHDIGKIGVPDSILNKPTALTDEEYEVMKMHVKIGGEILKDFTLIENVADGAKYHHERYDGSGYPNHLKAEEIPLNARIIGIADAFDAMTANRVYRKALDMDFVVSELKRCSGTQFDPGLVTIMLDLIQSGKLNVFDIYNQSVTEAKNE